MNEREIAICLGWISGGGAEAWVLRLLYKFRDDWDTTTRLASGWPELVSAWLLVRENRAQAEGLARAAGYRPP